MSNITNRKWFKNLKFIIICFLLIGVSLFCALHDFSNDRRGTNLIAHPIGWLGIGFFGYAFIFMLYKNIKYALQDRGMVAFTDEGLNEAYAENAKRRYSILNPIIYPNITFSSRYSQSHFNIH
jgi:hypothetical protein